MGGTEFAQRSKRAPTTPAAAEPSGSVRRESDTVTRISDVIRRAADSTLPAIAPTSRARRSASVIHRKIDVSPDTAAAGPIAEIADSTLGGNVQANANATLTLVRAGTAFEDHPWVKARAQANGGSVPSSVKKSMKWKWPHLNRDGHLPGIRLMGGYDEYYVNKMHEAADIDKKPTDTERIVVSTSTNDVFHTATHYGDRGIPAFTHMGKL